MSAFNLVGYLLLHIFKCNLLFLSPFECFAFLCQVCQWCSDSSHVFDESSEVSRHSHKASHFVHISRSRHVHDGLCFFSSWPNRLSADMETQAFSLLEPNESFYRINFQLEFLTYLEHLSQVSHVLIKGSAERIEIVKICFHPLLSNWFFK